MTDHSDYIMAYISDELSAGEKKQFEARLDEDEELHRQFQIWAKGVEYIKARSMLEEIENDPTRLYNKYYEPLSEEEIQMQMIRGSSDASLMAGISFYLEEEYDRACEVLEPHPEGSFFLGLTQLGMERYEEALKALLHYEKTHPEYPGVQWYLGLTQLRLGNLEEASSYFTQIAGSASSHKAEAEKLLIRIKKLNSTTDPQSSGRSGRHQKK